MQAKQITSTKGSIWRKWDLHLHTPFTKLSDHYKTEKDEDIWKSFCDRLENSDVEVFGITDYFSIDTFFTFKEHFTHHYPESAKVFFPNIEFRLANAVNRKNEEINIHVIFSNDIDSKQLDKFLNLLKTNTTTSNGNRVSCSELKSHQFESATINHIELIHCLKEIFGNHKPYLILAAANNAGIRPTNSPRKVAITDEIDKLCDAFFGGRQNVEYFLKENRYENSSFSLPKPVVCGCDAHSFADLDSYLGQVKRRSNRNDGKSEIIKDITWIRADKTFEGLKQILYEPQHRVQLSDTLPRQPLRRVESICFNFPSSTKIRRKDSDENQEFCLNQLNQPIYFSDYFTCIIGGRGTGKSTIINLLAEKLNERTPFFKRSELLIENKEYNIEDDSNNYIDVQGTNEVEFVSQGTIEKLAEGNELTKLVFNDRIKSIESTFVESERKVKDHILLLDDNIQILKDLINNQEILRRKQKEQSTRQKIVDSINDPNYRLINENIKNLKQEHETIQRNGQSYKSLLTDLSQIVENYQLYEANNDIQRRIQSIVNHILDTDELEYNTEGRNLKH